MRNPGNGVQIPMTAALDEIVQRLSSLPQVESIAVGGSRATGAGDAYSDYDLYVFITAPIASATRRELAMQFDPYPEIGNQWWGDADYWTDDKLAYDLMFWGAVDFEAGLRRVIELYQPSNGYSTAFWYTARNMAPLFDRAGWLASIQALAMTPYPDALVEAIIRHNRPLMRDLHTSYRNQIARAIALDDPVSVNHRVTELLATAFDIIFAHHRILHPGEKRQLSVLATFPGTDAIDRHIRAILIAAGDPAHAGLIEHVDGLCDQVEGMINATR
jgi:predicted nucleotidyltransferase